MPEADKALCTRLAEWQGWKPNCPWCGATFANTLPLSGRVGEDFRQCSQCENFVPTTNLPAYDTDPVTALELLGWLAEKPRQLKAVLYVNDLSTIVVLTLYREAATPLKITTEVYGPPLIALPEAIALAADKVRESKESNAKAGNRM